MWTGTVWHKINNTKLDSKKNIKQFSLQVVVIVWQLLQMCDTVWNEIRKIRRTTFSRMIKEFHIQHRDQKRVSYPAPTAQTGSCFLLVSCHYTSLCRYPPAAQFCRLFLHRVGLAPPDSEWAVGSAGTHTWLAGLGTGLAGARQQTGASGDDRSGRWNGELNNKQVTCFQTCSSKTQKEILLNFSVQEKTNQQANRTCSLKISHEGLLFKINTINVLVSKNVKMD